MKNSYLSKTHTILEISAWLLIAAAFAVAVHGMKVLPSTIATHFGIDGTPDGYGSPASLLLLPIIMVPCLGTISLITHFVSPECYNMPFKVREEHKVPVYRCVLTMMYATELEVAAFTLYAQIKSYYQSGHGMLAAVVLLMAVMAVTILYACKKAARYNCEKRG